MPDKQDRHAWHCQLSSAEASCARSPPPFYPPPPPASTYPQLTFVLSFVSLGTSQLGNASYMSTLSSR